MNLEEQYVAIMNSPDEYIGRSLGAIDLQVSRVYSSQHTSVEVKEKLEILKINIYQQKRKIMELQKLIIQVGPEWAELLKSFMVEDKEYDKISLVLTTERDNNRVWLPAGKQVFNAFRMTPLDKVRVVLLGTEPYEKADYSNGLAFGTNMEKLPASLIKLYDGIENDISNGLDLYKNNRTGDLSSWTNQGVLLLNCALTVSKDLPGSHIDLWKPFTENLIRRLCAVKRDLIFISLGEEAKKYTEVVNPFRNFVYLAEHPKTAAKEKRDWKHNSVFTKTNLAIKLNGLGEQIKW